MENSYNIGTVCGLEDYCGGLIGSLESCGTVTGSFFLAGCGTDNGAGTAAEEEQLKAQSTFENAGWDFDAVWCIAPDQNSGYPTLQIFSAPEKAAVTLSLSGQTYDEAQGRYYVTVSVHNQGEQSFSGTVYAAAYDGNRLVDVQEYAVSDLTEGETQTVSAELFTRGQVSQMKVFCWDLSSLRPVGAPAETAG